MRNEVASRTFDEKNDEYLPEVILKGKHKLEKQKSIAVESSQIRDNDDYFLPTIQPTQITLQPAISLKPKDWKTSQNNREIAEKHADEAGDVFPEKEVKSQILSAIKLNKVNGQYVHREKRLEKRLLDGTTEYSIDSAQLNVHKIPSISFTGTSGPKSSTRRRSIKTEKTIVVTEELIQIDHDRKQELQLKLSTTLPNKKDLKPILKVDKPKFYARPDPPTVQTVQPRHQHDPIYLPTPVMDSPERPRPPSRPEHNKSPEVKSASDTLGAHARKDEASNSSKKFIARPEAVDQSISHINHNVDFDSFMSTRLKRLELLAIDKQTDINVMKLRKELRLKDLEETKANQKLEMLQERYDDGPLNTSIRSQARIEPRSKVALEMMLENEAEKDTLPTYKPKAQYEIPVLAKEEKKDTGEWAYQRKAKLDKLAKEIDEKCFGNEKDELAQEEQLKRAANKSANLRLKQLDKLIAEESDDEDLDELEGKKDKLPDYPTYEEPLNEPTFEQPKNVVKFDYKNVKPKK